MYIKGKYKDPGFSNRNRQGLTAGEHICVVCGERFYVPNCEKWAYKHGYQKKVVFCSYHCMKDYRKVVAPEDNADASNYMELLPVVNGK